MVFPKPSSSLRVPFGSVVFCTSNDHLLPEGRSPQDITPIDWPISLVLTQADTVRAWLPVIPLNPLITTALGFPANCTARLNLPGTHWLGLLVNPSSVAMAPPPDSSVVNPEVWLKGNQ